MNKVHLLVMELVCGDFLSVSCKFIVIKYIYFINFKLLFITIENYTNEFFTNAQFIYVQQRNTELIENKLKLKKLTLI